MSRSTRGGKTYGRRRRKDVPFHRQGEGGTIDRYAVMPIIVYELNHGGEGGGGGGAGAQPYIGTTLRPHYTLFGYKDPKKF